MTQQPRAIVLGASGFIGNWVAKRASQDFETYGVARNSSAAIQLDLLDATGLRKLFSDIQPSVIFNLAGYGVDPQERDENFARELNAELPRKICEILQSHPDSLLIHAGTALEYGTAPGNLSEETEPQPTTWYGQTKLAGTKIILQAPVRSIVARLFTVYGPGEHSGRLLPSLIEAAQKHSQLNLTAGTQKRDFTYVEDVAEGFVRLANLRPTTGTLVNLCTGELHAVRHFVETAARILKIPQEHLRFDKLPIRPTEMEHNAVSTERLRKLIQWTPSTSIEVGIQRTVKFLES